MTNSWNVSSSVFLFPCIPSLSLCLPPGLTEESRCVGVARVGTRSQCIASDRLCSISQWDLGDPLHSMVIIGTVHPLEDKMLTLASNASRLCIHTWRCNNYCSCKCLPGETNNITALIDEIFLSWTTFTNNCDCMCIIIMRTPNVRIPPPAAHARTRGIPAIIIMPVVDNFSTVGVVYSNINRGAG